MIVTEPQIFLSCSNINFKNKDQSLFPTNYDAIFPLKNSFWSTILLITTEMPTKRYPAILLGTIHHIPVSLIFNLMAVLNPSLTSIEIITGLAAFIIFCTFHAAIKLSVIKSVFAQAF